MEAEGEYLGVCDVTAVFYLYVYTHTHTHIYTFFFKFLPLKEKKDPATDLLLSFDDR